MRNIIVNVIVILLLILICEIFDFAMVFFDHRFAIGILVSYLFYDHIYNWLQLMYERYKRKN